MNLTSVTTHHERTCSCSLLIPFRKICNRIWEQIYGTPNRPAFYEEAKVPKIRSGVIHLSRKDNENRLQQCALKVTDTFIELYIEKNVSIIVQKRGSDLVLDTFFPSPLKGGPALETILRAATLQWRPPSKRMIVQSNCWSWGFYMKQGATLAMSERDRVFSQISADRMVIASLIFDNIISSTLVLQLNRIEELVGANPNLQKEVYSTYGIPVQTSQDINYIALRTLEKFHKAPKSQYLEPFASYAGIDSIKLVFEENVLEEFRKAPEPGKLRQLGLRHFQQVSDKLKKGLQKIFYNEKAFITQLSKL